jgi:hypothetical protein
MSYLALLLLLFTTWALILVADARRGLVLARRTGREPGGVSIFPGIPVMPLGFLFLAWLLEQLFPSVGLLIVGGLHVSFIVFSLASIATSQISLR